MKFSRFHKDLTTLKAHHWKYWFDLYVGCVHNCLYCLYRSDPSFGQSAKANGILVSDVCEYLRAKNVNENGIIYLGATPDIYQPIEKNVQRTRRVLEYFCQEDRPIVLATKSPLILRDLDLLQDLGSKGLVEVSLTAVALEQDFLNILELGAPSMSERLKAAEIMVSKGVPVSYHVSPLIPGYHDKKAATTFVKKLRDTGAVGMYCCMLGLRPAYQDEVLQALYYFNQDLACAIKRTYSGNAHNNALSPVKEVVYSEMMMWAEICEREKFGFFCEHIPALDSSTRSDGIFRYKLPTTGDLYRYFAGQQKTLLLKRDLLDHLQQFPAVDDKYLDLVCREWDNGRLFQDTYYHPCWETGEVTSYVLKETIDLHVAEVMVCD